MQCPSNGLPFVRALHLSVGNKARDLLLGYAFVIGGAIVGVVFVTLLIIISQFDSNSVTFTIGILAGMFMCSL